MDKFKLPKIVSRRKKIVGRGRGSGKGGHTVGRGQKGQNSRKGGSVALIFEGVKTKKSLIKRLPLMRGKGKFKAKAKYVVINLEKLNVLKDGDKVNLETLIKANLVNKSNAIKYGVKILGTGEITKKLTLELPSSKSVASKITAAGGTVTS